MSLGNTILAIFSGIIIAAVSSWITVQLSLKRFRSERWWERKADTYARIIESLHNLKAFSCSHLDAFENGRKVPEKKDEELRLHLKTAHEEILKAIDMGSFLLSTKALERLKHFQKETEEAKKKESWFEFLDADCFATNNCLKDIVEIAKEDLSIKSN